MTELVYSDWLYIPKGVLYEPSIKAGLTFTQKGYKGDIVVSGWKENDNYLMVPREFYSKKYLESKDLEVVEKIPKFRKIHLEDRIRLDKFTYEKGRRIQKESFEALSKAGNGILSLACGLGKTILALKHACILGVPTIVIVETVDLLEQWIEAIGEHIKTPFKPGVLQGPESTWSCKKPITIAMIQTLANNAEEIPKDLREYFGLAVFDECHHLSSAHFVKTAPMFYGQRIGLSATPKREDGLEELYYAHIGKPFFRYIKQPLTPKAVFYSKVLPIDWNDREVIKNISDVNGELSFPKLWGVVGQDTEFQSGVVSLIKRAINDGRKVLLLSHRKTTLSLLYEKINRALPGLSGLVIGNVPREKRRRILKEKRVILGIMQLAKEGLDQKSLDTLILLEPFKAEGVLQQAAGRILRPYPNKKQPIVGILQVNHEVSYALCNKLRRHFKKWPTRVEIVKETF